MRKMTPDQAKHYIYAGYFPESPDKGSMSYCPEAEFGYIRELADLQDVFGHFSESFLASLLANEVYAENAERLFKLIWNDNDIGQLKKKAQKITDLYNVINNLETRSYELERELDTVDGQITFFKQELALLTAES